jgi:hypothetical protein
MLERYDGTNELRFQQAWINGRIGFLNLGFGSKEECYDLHESSISSGSLLYSRNARPILNLVIATRGYTPVPYTKEYVQFDALLAHGWFGPDEYVKNAWLHQKHFMVKLGGSLPVNFAMGLRHYAVWAGTSPDTSVGKLPSGLKAFRTVFFSESMDPDPNVPPNETLNKLGNHLGSWVYSLEFKFAEMEAGLGYETIFEDYSGFSKLLMRDGLWSAWLKPGKKLTFLEEFRYEFLDTRYQSGTRPDYGMDNFFNHFLYLSGWTYHGRTLGSPLITSPVLTGQEEWFLVNNRVKAHHLGAAFNFKSTTEFKILFTHSMNLGTYELPFSNPKGAGSVLAEWNHQPEKWPGWIYGIVLAADFGEMYGRNAGIMIRVRKDGRFFSYK